jgi:hypothetical protein
MSQYIITIDLDNDAFQDGGEGDEIGRILHRLSSVCMVNQKGVFQKLVDTNGNVVGKAVRKE